MDGTSGNDSIDGTSSSDVIDTFGGNDTVSAGGGADTVRGGGGQDTIDAGDGNDSVTGGGGGDSIAGGAGADLIYGDNSDQVNLGTLTYAFGGASITNAPSENSLEIPDGLESGDQFWVIVEDGSGTIFTKALQLELQVLDNGDFTLQPVAAKFDNGSLFDSLDGDFQAIQDHFDNNGNNFSVASSPSDDGYGIQSLSFDGDDGGSVTGFLSETTPTLIERADAGGDEISGGAGNDTIFGEAGGDTIDGGDGNDLIDGGDGNDSVTGGGGGDSISGGAGADLIYGDNSDQVNLGTLTYTFGGRSIGAGINENSLEIPDGLESGDRFWVIGNDNGDNAPVFTKAVQLELQVLADGDFTLQPVAAKYDDGSFFESLDGDFQAIQDHFDNNGNNISVASSPSDNGYGIQSLSFDGDDGGSVTGFLSETTPTLIERADAGGDEISGGAGNDTIFGEAGDDLIDGGDGDDILTGGQGSDTYTYNAGDGADTITDFLDHTGPADDGDQSNNDFIDLSGFYNDTVVASVNNSDADSSNDFRNELQLLRKDAEDGRLDGIIGGVDYSSLIQIDISIQHDNVAVTGNDLTFDNTNVICFVRGTQIATIGGLIPVEALKEGDRIITRDNGLQEIRWIGSRKVAARGKMAPVRIAAHALGDNERDLWLSPNHRVLREGWEMEMLFAASEVLVAAKHLVGQPGVTQVEGGEVEYFHILFDKHEVILSNGLWTESFHPGAQGIASFEADTLQEILYLFPELADESGLQAYGATARTVLKGYEASLLQ